MVYLSKCSEDQLLPLMQKMEDCVWIEHPTNKEEIGKGTSGVIYQVCCFKSNKDVECKYVIKVMKGRNEREVRREVEYQQKFMEAGTGIPILDAYMCPSERTSYIVMEKRDKDLLQYSKILADSEMSDKEVYKKLKELQEDAFQIIDKSFEKGLIHTDLIPDNWMLNVKEDLDFKDLVLIDFGYARDKKEDDNLNKIKEELGLSFKRLLKNVINARYAQTIRKEEMEKNPKREDDFNYEMKINGEVSDRINDLVEDVLMKYFVKKQSYLSDTSPKNKKRDIEAFLLGGESGGGLFSRREEDEGFLSRRIDDEDEEMDDEGFLPRRIDNEDEEMEDEGFLSRRIDDEDEDEDDKSNTPKKRKLFFGDALKYYFN